MLSSSNVIDGLCANGVLHEPPLLSLPAAAPTTVVVEGQALGMNAVEIGEVLNLMISREPEVLETTRQSIRAQIRELEEKASLINRALVQLRKRHYLMAAAQEQDARKAKAPCSRD